MSGPFYFAWVEASETTFDPIAHAREDEDVASLQVTHSEGDFAQLEIEIRNPRIGLLAPARKVWAWVSFNRAFVPDEPEQVSEESESESESEESESESLDIVPLFFGRLVGVPNNMHLEVVTLIFTARPADYSARKETLAATMRVAPYYDPVFISADRRNDPDVVLEGYSRVWHIDRVTHIVTASDVLTGEDGVEEFLESEVPYDTIGVTLGQTPLRSVQVDGVVQWTQSAQGQIVVYDKESFICPTAALASVWPKTGTSIGGGWEVTFGEAHSSIDDIKSKVFSGQTETIDINGQTLNGSLSSTEPDPPIGGARYVTSFSSTSSASGGVSQSTSGIEIPTDVTVWGSLTLNYKAARARQEHIRFTLSADMQALVTMPGEEETLLLPVSGTDVGVPLEDASVPIFDSTRRSYFPTARGIQSVEYLIMLARARLVQRARAVEVNFECSFDRAIALSLRKNALLHDDRIPGGSALGKIVKYSFSADGDTGRLIGTVTMGCAVGHGGEAESNAGTPSYVVADYVVLGYQFYIGQVVAIGATDVAYTVPADIPNDDGLVFPLGLGSAFLVAPAVVHDASAQEVLPTESGGNEGENIAKYAEALLNAIESRLTFTLYPVTGSKFETEFDLTVSTLAIPAAFDLEAPA